MKHATIESIGILIVQLTEGVRQIQYNEDGIGFLSNERKLLEWHEWQVFEKLIKCKNVIPICPSCLR